MRIVLISCFLFFTHWSLGNTPNEQAVLTYYERVKNEGFQSLIETVHPETVQSFRGAYLSAVAAAMEVDPVSVRSELLSFFNGDDLKTVEQESDMQFAKRLYSFMDARYPMLASEFRYMTVTILGSVIEGDTEHFVLRVYYQNKRADVSYDKLQIISVGDYRGEPRIKTSPLIDSLGSIQ